MGPEGEQAWGVQCSRAKQQLGASSRKGARGGEEAGTRGSTLYWSERQEEAH